MQAVVGSTYDAVPRSHAKPILDSYDSSEEFSFYHWVEVCTLVEQGDTSWKDEENPSSAEIDKVLEEALSEVETTAAYQHFSSDVV